MKKLKNLLALLMAVLMVLSLAACDDGNTDKPGNTDSTNPAGGSTVNASFFSIDFDESWINVEDEFYDDEDGCTAVLQVLDPEDPEYYLIEATVDVDIDDPYDFREDLVYYGFNQYEYKVNNAYDTVNIGGVDLLKYDDGDDTIIYFNRIEGAGATVSVEFDVVDINDSRIDTFLEGITFNIEDTGNTDGPWEWEGEPFSAEDASVAAGDFTIKTEFVPFEAPVTTFETFDHYVAAIGDKVYVLVDGELNVCHYDGSELVFVEKIELPDDDFDRIEATSDGKLWVSGGMNDVICLKDGNTVATYEDIDELAIHPSGTWGVNFFTSNECEILTFSGDSYTSTPVVYKEADTIMHMCVDEKNVFVCANAADDSGHKVFVYDKAGKLQKTLCDAEGEGLGSITFITQTDNGYIGFDGNMRDVFLWDNNGKFIAELDDTDLFNSNYPWFCASTRLDDGNILTIMTDERADESAMELVAFILSGF